MTNRQLNAEIGVESVVQALVNEIPYGAVSFQQAINERPHQIDGETFLHEYLCHFGRGMAAFC